MALTIDTQPSTTTIHSCYRPIRYVVTSNLAAIAKCQCEVYINGALIKTIVHDPDIGYTNQFTFDISGFVRDNISLYNPSTSLLHIAFAQAGTSKYIHCVFNEVVLTGSVYEVSGTDYTSSTAYTFNGILQHEETQDWSNWYDNDSDKLWLTNMPDESLVARGDTIGVPFVMSGTANDYLTKLYQYQDETFLGTSTQATGAGFTDNKTGWCTIDTSQLNGLSNKIEIELWDNTNTTQLSSARTYRIGKAACEDDKRIWFVNQYGGYEAFSFTGEFVEGLEISTREYKKILAYNFSIPDRGLTTFRVDAFAKFRTSTRPLNRAEYRWLRELKTSPSLILQEGANFIPIIQLNRDDYRIEGNSIGRPMILEYVKANDLIIQ
jgi:hypothetical protein